MGTIAVIGESPKVDGFGLAGVQAFPALTQDEVVDSWRRLPTDVEIVILTATAAAALDAAHVAPPNPVVLPPYPVVLPP